MKWLTYAVAVTSVAVAAPVVAQGNGKAKGNDEAQHNNGAQQAKGGGNGHPRGNGAENGNSKARDSSGMMAGPEFAGKGNDVDADRKAVRIREDYRTGAAWRDNRGNSGKRGDLRLARDDPSLDRRNPAHLAPRATKDRAFGEQRVLVPACPPGLAKKNNGCLPPGLAGAREDPVFGYDYNPNLFGLRVPAQGQYAYRDGYLLPIGNAAGGYIPLLGGALSIGHVWPQTYPSYQLPDYVGNYFGVGDRDRYRYADDVVYRVNPETAAIEAVAALLTGSNFEVGGRLPPGYDVYNLPRPYRDRYVDSADSIYRYADGRIYQVDPATMLIAKAIELVL